jgi:DNA polymerase-3 subunit epsilon
MNNFVAIDVETANYYPTSICAIGAVKVVDQCIVDRFYQLVKPEPNWYVRKFSEEIHGIYPKDTNNQPNFDYVWESLSNFIGDLPLVAHNKSFDERCIRATCRMYQIDFPENGFYCTLSKARREIPKQMCSSYSLPHLCDFLGIPFNNHHNALADAEACAKIAISIL